MNEEQKQAIKELKHFINMTAFWKEKEYTSYAIDNHIGIVLHLIDEQQKEIELMKTKINKIVLMIKENYNSDFYDDYETIAGLRDDIYNLLMKK